MPYAHGPLRVLELAGTPRQRGESHGSAHADSIRAYALDRARLVVDGTPMRPGEALSLVGESIPFHAEYAPDLFEETEALAEAAGLTVEEALLVSGYTDFLDVVRATAGHASIEDNCTAMLIPDGVAVGGAVLAQTWDMHKSATQHVVLLRIRDLLESLVFTTLGCVGQIGMNSAGISIGINNLATKDGRAGVAWPFVVRKVLQQTDLEAALSCIVEAPLAGAHNYLLMGPDGAGYNVEASPTERVVTPLLDTPLTHTNHCLAPAVVAVEAKRDAALLKSSHARIHDAVQLLDRPRVTIEEVMAITADERSICQYPEPKYETCGAAIMRPSTGDFWACWGRPSESEYEHHTVGVRRA